MHKFTADAQHITLANGLRVHLLHRPDFHQMVAMLTVDFGGRDHQFTWQGQSYTLPAGVAHFLEHRLFSQGDYDALTRLSELGADANAFTSQSRTSYYLTTLANNQRALQELLSFTQTTFLNEADVVREREIIGQEADMYADDPDSNLYRAILKEIYPNDPLGMEILGTHESLAATTVADLQLAFDAFYQPGNMDVVIAGAFDVERTLATIEASVAGQRPAGEVAQAVAPAPTPSQTETVEIDIPTNRTKIAVGMRYAPDADLPVGTEALKTAVAVSLATDLVFGELSPMYMEWYDAGLIDDDFTIDFEWERGFAFVTAAADTGEPEEVIQLVKEALNRLDEHFMSLQADFVLVQRDALGRAINRLNHLEGTVTHFEGKTFGDNTLEDEIELIEQLTVDDVHQSLKNVSKNLISSVIARPE